MTRKPLIGITPSLRTDERFGETFSMAANYVGAVAAAGGVPVVLPPHGDAVEELLDAAAVDEVLVEPLDFVFRHESLDAYFDHQKAMSNRLKTTLAKLGPADHTRLRDAIDARLEQFVEPDGSVVLPARTWVAAALG